MILRASIDNAAHKDGFTSIADFNNDGALDIIVSTNKMNVYV